MSHCCSTLERDSGIRLELRRRIRALQRHLSIGYQILLKIHAHFGASGLRVWVDRQARPPERSATFTTEDNVLTSILSSTPHFSVAFLERGAPPPTRLLHIERLKGLSMLIYYPLEHAYYLASNSIPPLSPEKQSESALWSCRAWAAYVVLQIVHLKEDWRPVRRRERALERDFASRTVDKTGAEMERLREGVRKRKDAVWSEFVVNIGYLPLKVH